MPGQRLRRLEGELETRRGSGTRRATRLEEDVERRRAEFDPTEAARTAAGAAFEDFQEDFTRGIGDLRGEQVGMGRIRTGFGGRDEDRLVEDLNRRISREIARGAFTSAGMELQNIGGIQRAGEEARVGADAALAGGLDRATAAVNERRQRRRSLLGTLGGVAGAVAGTVFGPAGTAIGNRLGEAVAARVGG